MSGYKTTEVCQVPQTGRCQLVLQGGLQLPRFRYAEMREHEAHIHILRPGDGDTVGDGKVTVDCARVVWVGDVSSLGVPKSKMTGLRSRDETYRDRLEKT